MVITHVGVDAEKLKNIDYIYKINIRLCLYLNGLPLSKATESARSEAIGWGKYNRLDVYLITSDTFDNGEFELFIN